jgi:hypothetical protein
VTPQVVTDSSDSVIGIRPTQGHDLLFEHRTLLACGDRRCLAAETLDAGLRVVLPPLVNRVRANADQLADLACGRRPRLRRGQNPELRSPGS